jgi:hypothetical protein
VARFAGQRVAVVEHLGTLAVRRVRVVESSALGVLGPNLSPLVHKLRAEAATVPIVLSEATFRELLGEVQRLPSQAQPHRAVDSHLVHARALCQAISFLGVGERLALAERVVLQRCGWSWRWMVASIGSGSERMRAGMRSFVGRGIGCSGCPKSSSPGSSPRRSSGCVLRLPRGKQLRSWVR